MFHYYDSSTSEIFIFDDYLINQIREGEEITMSHNYGLNVLLKKHFNNKNMVYIANRINSYSVDPIVYKEIEKIPNLLAIIIITDEEAAIKNAKSEKKFFKKPFKICHNLTEAVMWVDKIIYNKN